MIIIKTIDRPLLLQFSNATQNTRCSFTKIVNKKTVCVYMRIDNIVIYISRFIYKTIAPSLLFKIIKRNDVNIPFKNT